MSNTTDLSPSEAQALVERIAKSYGWLPESERKLMSPIVLEMLANVETVFSAAARTLARDIHKNKAQFVLELIQNAEDNEYKDTTESGLAPYINFSIYPDRIVIENNERGFSVMNVESICKIAVSSKKRTDAQYYFGEKGIGFKSVFKVASKVCIESGPFSFFFEQPSLSDTSGMGMITPVHFVREEPSQSSVTRITLILRDEVDNREVDKQFFDELPETLLLFFKKLKKVVITRYDAKATLSRYTAYTSDCDGNQKVTLTKVCQAGCAPPEASLARFFTIKKQLFNLPSDDHRDYNTAEIVLAFPVDGKDVPVIEGQDVYAYHPIGRSGFPFMIQSDFITQRNGHELMDCPRNRAIIDGVAQAFVDGVLKFCQHPTLQYQWIRFLWQTQVSGPGDIWTDLLPKIQAILKSTPVLRPSSHLRLRLISELQVISGDFKDAFGRPLFSETPKCAYLATEYDSVDIFALRPMGLRYFTVLDVIERIQEDVESPSSQIKSKATTTDWYQRAAKFLLQSFDGQCIPELLPIKIIPLRDGNFTSTLEGTVYFPDTDGMLIPTDLGLRLVEPESIKDNVWRKRLFSALGVTDAPVDEVRKILLGKYREKGSRPKITLPQSVAHLQYLYWTHQMSKPKRQEDVFSNFITLSKNGGFNNLEFWSKFRTSGTTPGDTNSSSSLGSPTGPAPSSTSTTRGLSGTGLRRSPRLFADLEVQRYPIYVKKPSEDLKHASKGHGPPCSSEQGRLENAPVLGAPSSNPTRFASTFSQPIKMANSTTSVASPASSVFGASLSIDGTRSTETFGQNTGSIKPTSSSSLTNTNPFDSSFGRTALSFGQSAGSIKPTSSSSSLTNTNPFDSSFRRTALSFGQSTGSIKPTSSSSSLTNTNPFDSSFGRTALSTPVFGSGSETRTEIPTSSLEDFQVFSAASPSVGVRSIISCRHISKTPFSEIKPSKHPFSFVAANLTIKELARAAVTKQCPGTRDEPYQPTIQKDPDTLFQIAEETIHSICRQPAFEEFSYEELRLEDYSKSGKYNEYDDLWVFNQQNALVPCRKDVYFPSMEEFGVEKLLSLSSDNYPRLPASCLSTSYFASVPDTSGGENWKSWLEEQLGVLKHPRLVDSRDSTKLSDVLEYVANFRADKFLGILKAYWDSYEEIMTPDVIKTISNVSVPCKTGDICELWGTFLPHLEPTSQNFLRGKEQLPFLELYPPSMDEEWMFLATFGVCTKYDVEVYLSCLHSILIENEDAKNLQEPERVFKLYEAIESQYLKSETMGSMEEDSARIFSFFEDSKALYIPGYDESVPTWAAPSECLWEGPSYLTCRCPLVDFKEYHDSPVLTDFLCRTLMVRDVSWGHLLEELQSIRELEMPDHAVVFDIYSRLDKFRTDLDDTELNSLRNRFQTLKLVFAMPQGWYSPDECIWCDRAQITKQVPIEAQYVGLQDFFVEFLRVEVPQDLGLLVKKLEIVATTTRSVESAKNLFWQINSLHPTTQELAAVQMLAIFPVTIGDAEPQLQSREKDFTIVDRERLVKAFRGPGVSGPLAILDFPKLEDVHNLRPILSALDVEDRYLSNAVRRRIAPTWAANNPDELNEALTISLRRRAYALFRIAVSFDSPRSQHNSRSLYQTLLHTQVIQTEQMTSKFVLVQDGFEIQTETEKCMLYIKEEASSLRIYVPKNLKDLEFCYRRWLPRELTAMLMTEGNRKPTVYDEPTAMRLVSDILSCSDSIIDDVLEDAGVVQVPFADEYVPVRLRGDHFGAHCFARWKGVPVRLPGWTNRRIAKIRPTMEELEQERDDSA